MVKVRAALAAAAVCFATVPTPLHAQLGLVEGLFRNVTDIGFYGGRGGFLPSSTSLETGAYGLYNFGVELLFQVAAPEVPEDGEEATPEPFTFELAVGYGQIAGFHSADDAIDLRASVRELPAIAFYASHAASGLYAGMRTGLLQTNSLQAYTEDGRSFSGTAQSFQLGGAVGMAVPLSGTYAFVEGGWMLRHFPSIEWRTGELPAAVPRSLRLSGWQMLVGLQVPIR
jgi:hypothetical protein